MKKTPVLCKQHVGRMIKRHWYIQGNIKVQHTPAEENLKSLGYEVVDINEILKPPRMKEAAENAGSFEKSLPRKKSHPDYNHEPCFIFKDKEVIIEGLEQTKILTNTVEIHSGLPEHLIEKEKNLNLSDEIHTETKKKLRLSCIFEAMQEKLPKRKDPLRPSWVFAREYGITEARKNELLCKNLVTVCEKFGSSPRNKSVISDAFFSSPIQYHNKKIQLEISSELVVTTAKRLKMLAEPSVTYDISLPVIDPMECTAGLKPFYFYRIQDIYSPGTNTKWPYIQTAFLHFNPTQVKNIIEEEVTESQIVGRSLIKAFCIALAQARAVFGHDIKKLPKSIVVPVVQTDGKMFHFAVFQLNTLDLDRNSKVKNIFWSSKTMPLYSECEYQEGRPVLKGYNPDIIKKLLMFYNIE